MSFKDGRVTLVLNRQIALELLKWLEDLQKTRDLPVIGSTFLKYLKQQMEKASR